MRNATLAALVLLLGAGSGLPVPGLTQETLSPLTSFRGEFDPVVALTVVYGREPWNDLLAVGQNTFGNGRDFIEPLYDVAYVEGGVRKHAVIATLTPRPRSQYNCHACPPMLGGAVFRRDGELWRVESRGLKIEPGHAWFDGRHGRLSLVRLGPDRYGLLHQVHDASQGRESMRASLILGADGVLASRLVSGPVEGPGPGACGAPAQHLKIDAVEAGAGATGFYDIVVDALWNEARCEPVEGGNGASSPGRSCQRTARYRYREGTYIRTDAGIEVCMQLPEQQADFRG